MVVVPLQKQASKYVRIAKSSLSNMNIYVNMTERGPPLINIKHSLARWYWQQLKACWQRDVKYVARKQQIFPLLEMIINETKHWLLCDK